MPDTFTANYNFTKPEPNASRDTWGVKWNANIDSIDGILKSLSNNKLQYDSTAKTSSADVNFVGPAPKVNGKRIAVTDTVDGAALPAGSIIMWAGSIASIPAGFALCNGQNGTPDLRNRFIVGAGDLAQTGTEYEPGTFGGAKNHTHTINGHAITPAQMPSHVHAVNDPTHSHAVYDPGHAHSYTRYTSGTGPEWTYGVAPTSARGTDTSGTSVSGTGISLYNSGTGIWLSPEGGSQAHTHTAQTADSRPPFFALCFIMKLPLQNMPAA